MHIVATVLADHLLLIKVQLLLSLLLVRGNTPAALDTHVGHLYPSGKLC